MKKLSILVLLIISGLLINGCGTVQNNTGGSGGTTSFNSVTDTMRQCAPDLGFSSFSSWDHWTPTHDLGILYKHFHIDGSETIYTGSNMLDIFTDALVFAAEVADADGNFADTVTISVKGVNHAMNVTGNIEVFTGTVTLPGILSVNYDISGLTHKASINRVSADGTTRLESITLYYGIVNNVQTLIHLQNNIEGGDTLGYSKIGLSNGQVIYRMASAGSQSQSLLFFEGDSLAKTSRFSIKSSTSSGWAVFGGGSVANANSLYAVRAQDMVDTTISPPNGGNNDGANFGNDTGYYLIISNENIGSSSHVGTPLAATNLTNNLGAEEDVANYIRIGHPDSLGWTKEYATSIPLTLTES